MIGRDLRSGVNVNYTNLVPGGVVLTQYGCYHSDHSGVVIVEKVGVVYHSTRPVWGGSEWVSGSGSR